MNNDKDQPTGTWPMLATSNNNSAFNGNSPSMGMLGTSMTNGSMMGTSLMGTSLMGTSMMGTSPGMSNYMGGTSVGIGNQFPVGSLHGGGMGMMGRSFEERPAIEERFFQHFTCCGMDLKDFHGLLEHFEDTHVLPDGTPDDRMRNSLMSDSFMNPSHSQQSVGSLLKFNFSPMGKPSQITEQQNSQQRPDQGLDQDMAEDSAATPVDGDFGMEMEMEMDDVPAPSSAPQFPLEMETSGSGNPDLSTMIPPSQASGDFANILQNNTSPTAPTNLPGQQFNTILNSYFNKGSLFDMKPSDISTPASPSTHTSSSDIFAQDADEGPPNEDRPYRCTVTGCDKAYKQPNGLKYHRIHGHCGIDTEAEDKPFVCHMGNCGKRYKNLNGLRYHYQHSGQHGNLGLHMLSQQTHPLPAMSPSSSKRKATSLGTSPTDSTPLSGASTPVNGLATPSLGATPPSNDFSTPGLSPHLISQLNASLGAQSGDLRDLLSTLGQQ